MRLQAWIRPSLGFLACAGWIVAGARAEPASPAPPLSITAPQPPSPPHVLEQSNSEWRQVLARVPQLAPYAAEFASFAPTATKTALERGGRTRDSVATWSFVDGPFEWKPNAKQRFWIVPGFSGPRVVIAVFSAGDEPEHLASAVLLEPEPALAVGWSTSEPNRLLWTTCYGCRGLGGSIDLASDGSIAFVYR
jgi:hypothetical protein